MSTKGGISLEHNSDADIELASLTQRPIMKAFNEVRSIERKSNSPTQSNHEDEVKEFHVQE